MTNLADPASPGKRIREGFQPRHRKLMEITPWLWSSTASVASHWHRPASAERAGRPKGTQRVPAEQIGVGVRAVARARRFADRGVRVRPSSCKDPAALRQSFEDAEQILLVSSNAPTPTRSACTASASRPPSRQGPSASSTPATRALSADSPFSPARAHSATERILTDSGVACTSLRNGFYAHSLGLAAQPLAGDRRGHGSRGRAGLLDRPRRRRRRSGGAQNSGREVTRIAVDDEQWAADKVAAGTPEAMARMTLTTFQAAREGRLAGVHPCRTASSAANLAAPPTRSRTTVDGSPQARRGFLTVCSRASESCGWRRSPPW
ncbi:hypothetical protein ACQ4WX_03650 [Streptomyces lasalocidi]